MVLIKWKFNHWSRTLFYQIKLYTYLSVLKSSDQCWNLNSTLFCMKNMSDFFFLHSIKKFLNTYQDLLLTHVIMYLTGKNTQIDCIQNDYISMTFHPFVGFYIQLILILPNFASQNKWVHDHQFLDHLVQILSLLVYLWFFFEIDLKKHLVNEGDTSTKFQLGNWCHLPNL